MLLTIALLVAQDPFLPDTPGWERHGDEAWQYVGTRVVNVGDVTGNQRDDLLVTSPGVAQVTGVHGRGRAELFEGTPDGWSQTPVWTVWGDKDFPSQTIDWDAAGIGDVDGNGIGDLAICSWHGGATLPGAVHVFYCFDGGPQHGPDAQMSQADWIAIGPGAQGSGFGYTVLGPGDVDGDGFDDLLVGWRGFTDGETNEGGVFLFPGSMGELTGGPVASWTDATWSVVSNRTQGYFGDRLHAVGDVNGDGDPDFAVTADGGPQDTTLLGRHWVFTSATGGLLLDANATAFATLDGGGMAMSRDLAAADFDPDGYSDLVLGFPSVWIGGLKEPMQLWRGGPNGFSLASWTVESTPWFESAGSSLAAGDLDADGRPDLAVLSTSTIGRVRVFRGSDGLEPIESASSWEYPIRPVATARVEILGDPEGDGTQALALGEPEAKPGDLWGAGSAKVFSRVGDAPDACPFAHPDWEMEEATWLGRRHEVQLADIDHDGHDDLVVGSPTSPHIRVYTWTGTGLSQTPTFSLDLPDPEAWRGVVPVAVGDVDDDEYEDVLILRLGRRYLASDGIALHAHAAAYLLSGGPGAPSITWSATQQTSDPIHFAWAGALLDLDGDGFDDVVLGAPGHERDPWAAFNDPYDLPGAVFAWPGGASGVNGGTPGDELNTSWTATDLDSSGDFGHRLRSAGDLDGDGDEELVVAAPFTRDVGGERVGALYLYRGDPGWPAGNPDWNAVGTEPGGNLGIAFDAGVDVTGNGFPDLVTLRRDKAWPVGLDVWPGQTGGFPTAPTRTVDDVGKFQLLEDFTGDGKGDIAVAHPYWTVREPMEGQVGVVHGGFELAKGYERWRTAGEKARVYQSLPTSPVRGDIDGDGRSDLVATSKWYLNLESEERARLTCYYGRRKPLLELSATTVTGGQVVGVGHYGGEPFLEVRFVPATFGGMPFSGLQRVFAVGQVDGDCCWHVDWTVPTSLPVGTYQVRTVQPTSRGRFKSNLVELVVQ